MVSVNDLRLIEFHHDYEYVAALLRLNWLAIPECWRKSSGLSKLPSRKLNQRVQDQAIQGQGSLVGVL
jgi:hypothetical protein